MMPKRTDIALMTLQSLGIYASCESVKVTHLSRIRYCNHHSFDNDFASVPRLHDRFAASSASGLTPRSEVVARRTCYSVGRRA